MAEQDSSQTRAVDDGERRQRDVADLWNRVPASKGDHWAQIRPGKVP